jgi:hypothetical protein
MVMKLTLNADKRLMASTFKLNVETISLFYAKMPNELEKAEMSEPKNTRIVSTSRPGGFSYDLS